MRKKVVEALVGLDAVAVENPVYPGTPDINFVEGWIELKILDAWPKRASTKVTIRCFTPQQRIWLHRRCRRGGRAFFLLKVDNDWLLFDGMTAAEQIGKLTKAEMFEHCIWESQTPIRTNELIKVLKTWSDSTSPI